MQRGICQLCLDEVNLQQSHYLGRAFSRLSIEDGELPVFMSPYLIIQDQKQIKDYLLCWNCEQRFAAMGENYVLKVVNRKEGFEMMHLVRTSPFRRIQGEYSVYRASDLGVNTDSLAYFALSTVWRGGVHVWRTFEGRATGGLQLEHQERIRDYLVGTTPYPRGVVVKVSVACDMESQNSLMFPRINPDQQDARVFTFMTRGIWFDVAVGESLPAYMQDNCCVSSLDRPIFVGDFSRFLGYEFEQFKGTARVLA